MDRCSCLSLSISRGVLNRGFCGRHLASEEMRLVSIGMTDCAKHGCERRIQASRAAWTRVRAYLYDDHKVKFLGKLVFLWELNRATIAGRSIEERTRHRSGTAPVLTLPSVRKPPNPSSILWGYDSLIIKDLRRHFTLHGGVRPQIGRASCRARGSLSV